MNFPDEILGCFSEAEAMIQRRSWYPAGWVCCSGLWRTERYGDTVVLRLTRQHWSSTKSVSLHEGGEIQYAAWIDPQLFRARELRFEMHVFKFVGAGRRNIRKGDFTDAFRERAQASIQKFGHHDMRRGPAVPYAGSYRFSDADDLRSFLVADFDRFVSLAPLVEERLNELLRSEGP